MVWLNFAKEWPLTCKTACRAYRCFKHRLSEQDDETQPCFEFSCPHCVLVFQFQERSVESSWRTKGCRELCVFFSQCPVCQTEHSTHLKCMHHCQYSSRRGWQEIMASNFPALDPALVQSLDERDLETRMDRAWSRHQLYQARCTGAHLMPFMFCLCFVFLRVRSFLSLIIGHHGSQSQVIIIIIVIHAISSM